MRPWESCDGAQVDQSLVELQVRTAVSPEAIAANLHRELAAFDTRLGIVGMIDARDSVNGSIVAERLIAKLSATLGFWPSAWRWSACTD